MLKKFIINVSTLELLEYKDGKPYANRTGVKAVQDIATPTATASTDVISTPFPQDPYFLNW
jgi:hypothetical protein